MSFHKRPLLNLWAIINYAGCCRISSLIAVCCFSISVAKTDVPVFLLSGQSNMTGYANASGLNSDQKKNVDNVKIYMDLVWEGDASKLRKWLTLGPGFGSNGNSIGPELFLGRKLSEVMPETKIAFIKCSSGSTYLGKKEDWLPPSSNNGVGGDLYQRMMRTIDEALKKFSDAFDTSQYTPRWAGFVWLQGEFDAMDQSLSNAYEKNLTNLINDIRTDLNSPDLPVIIPMIDAQGQWTHHTKIRNANIAVVKNMKNVDTLDTKGFETDGTHYKAQGQVKIGTIAAQRWLDMGYDYRTGFSLDICTKGQGEVNRNPDKDIYEKGTEVTLTAIPVDGWVFDSWSGDASGSTNPLKVNVNAQTLIYANFKTAEGREDLIINGNFSFGADQWTFNKKNGTGSGDVENGEYKLSIGATGTNDNDIQVVQSGIRLEKDKTYRLVFDARTSANRKMTVDIRATQTPDVTFLTRIISGENQVDLTTEKEKFTIDFVMEKETSDNSSVEFNVGTNTASVYIDNVSLFEIDGTYAIPVFNQRNNNMFKVRHNGNTVNIMFKTSEKNSATLKVYDLKGRVIYTDIIKINGVMGSYSFNCGEMTKGYYVIKITGEKGGRTRLIPFLNQ